MRGFLRFLLWAFGILAVIGLLLYLVVVRRLGRPR